MRNLFLTGSVGCGKSTSIAAALGEALPLAGGFLTVRQRDETGCPAAFLLMRPDGTERGIILEGSSGQFTMHPEVFEDLGIRLLEEGERHDYVVLDEIGGFELLSESFTAALRKLLESDVPCIGVMKGRGPAGAMIRKLGLEAAYTRRAEELRLWMQKDEHTVLYECGQFDPEGLRLAQSWVEAHVKHHREYR